MKYGFVKVAVATPKIRVADCMANAEAILALFHRAEADGARLLALPELCVTGYTCGDLFLQDALLEGAKRALARVAEGTRGSDMLLVLGLPLALHNALYNCAAVLQKGRVLGVVPKTALPNYGEYYEKRHFVSAPAAPDTIELLGSTVPFADAQLFCCRELPEFVFGIEICEDLWSPRPPSVGLAGRGATVIVNSSASDEAVSKSAYRRQLVQVHSAKLNCAYLFASAGDGESTTDLVFSGHDMILENGSILAESIPFGPGYAVSEVDVAFLSREKRRLARGLDVVCTPARVPFSQEPSEAKLTRCYWRMPFVPDDLAEADARCRETLQIQSQGLKKRIEHVGADKLVLGISGGVDSALALLVCRDALALLGRPATDIEAVTMPCFGTTRRTRGNAEKLCDALGAPCREIDLSEAVRRHLSDLGHPTDKTDTAYENAQARERTQVLMDTANMVNGLVVGTGDLSELALGFATFGGDHLSMYGVNADVPKTLIRAILRYVARTEGGALAPVLEDIVATPVSPELLPPADGAIRQITEELVGPYELHDFFLYHMLRRGAPREKILHLARYAFGGEYDDATLERWLDRFYSRFFSQQFKRSCMPDGPRVGSVALSPRGDWRMPSDASPAVWRE